MYNGLIDATEFQPTALTILNDTVKQINLFQVKTQNSKLTNRFFQTLYSFPSVSLPHQFPSLPHSLTPSLPHSLSLFVCFLGGFQSKFDGRIF
jgi:hypothetical protein